LTSGLSVESVAKSFGRQAVLEGVDLEVPAGTFTAVLGPSGSGKTTLLRIVAGFDRADAGEVRLGGQVVEGRGRHLPPEDRHIGYVPQEGALFPHMRVAGNIGFGLDRRARGQRVAEMLELIGMTTLAGRYPHELSGGQQQRVALARALANRPEVVLLDEPFSALDAAMRTSVRSDVRDLLREAGTTAVIVTHDQEEALSIADRVAVIDGGRIVQHGPPHEVYTQPATPNVGAFVGRANLISGKVSSDGVQTPLGPHPVAGGVPDLHRGAAVTVLIRPEQLCLRAPVDARDGDRPATVEGVDYHGHGSTVRVVLADGLGLRVSAPGTVPFRIGDQVVVGGPDGDVVAWGG
jgi:iron(III) transport system ATP-binding protein